MGWMIVRDDVLWIRHIHDDPELTRRMQTLEDEAPIDLLIEGRPARFLKMRRGRDGRPTPGLKPSAGSSSFWKAMQARRGESVAIGLAAPSAGDPYLKSLTATLGEWDSPEDCAAYDDLPVS